MPMFATLPLPGFAPMASSESPPFAVASLARTSARPGRVAAWTVSAPGSGVSLRASLASFDPISRSWRTSGLFAVEDSPLFSQTLPRSGMTRSGTLFLLPPLVRLTSVIASGSSPLLPTPTTGDAKASGSRNTAASRAHPGLSLTDWARGDGGTGRLLPTPQAQDHRNCADYSDRSRGHSPQLRHLGPGRLSPRFVEWMMGYPPGFTDLLELDACDSSEIKTATA